MLRPHGQMVLHGLGSLCDSIPRYGGLQQELTALCKHKSFIITLSSTSGEEIYKMYIKNPQKSKVSFRGSKHFYFSVGRGIQFRVVFFFFLYVMPARTKVDLPAPEGATMCKGDTITS